jgi:C4-type Zn-finger protein
MKPDRCPKCGSDEIGELDSLLELPYTDEDYENAGGRYYCVACGWYQKTSSTQIDVGDEV